MNTEYISNFKETALKQFKYYKLLGDKTFGQLTSEQILQVPSAGSNSIAVIVNHLSGNMLSRWTNLWTEDGEKAWRQRDREFEEILLSKEAVIESWEKGWIALFEAIESINENNFETLIYIRNQGHTIVEAIMRQVAHYAYHVGQIVYLGKLYNEQWQSLSIPKNESTIYNKEKFSKEKGRGHFTDEFLK